MTPLEWTTHTSWQASTFEREGKGLVRTARMVYLTVQFGFVLLEGKIVFVRDDAEDEDEVERMEEADDDEESGGVRRWLKLWLWVEMDDDVSELDVLSQDVRVEDVEGYEEGKEGLMKRASKSCW